METPQPSRKTLCSGASLLIFVSEVSGTTVYWEKALTPRNWNICCPLNDILLVPSAKTPVCVFPLEQTSQEGICAKCLNCLQTLKSRCRCFRTRIYVSSLSGELCFTESVLQNHWSLVTDTKTDDGRRLRVLCRTWRGPRSVTTPSAANIKINK